MIKSSKSGKRNVNCCQLVQTYKNCFKERQFQLVEKPYIRFASGGFTPGPPMGHRPCTLVGALAAPRPPHLAWGPLALSAAYFLTFSFYFKSFWQPWLT